MQARFIGRGSLWWEIGGIEVPHEKPRDGSPGGETVDALNEAKVPTEPRLLQLRTGQR